MGIYREHVLPRLVDLTCGTPALHSWREEVAAGLRGTIVEIGFGSGLNVPHYPPEVTTVYAVEPALVARRLAADRIEQSQVSVVHVGLDGTSLPLPDDSCDGALSTFTMCTIPDVERALTELRRVLRPGAPFHFLEHGLSPEESVGTWQRRIEPVQKRVADGCHLTRDPIALVEAAGMTVLRQRSRYGRGPKPWNWLTLATARND